jgi:hypothetical protein
MSVTITLHDDAFAPTLLDTLAQILEENQAPGNKVEADTVSTLRDVRDEGDCAETLRIELLVNVALSILHYAKDFGEVK